MGWCAAVTARVAIEDRNALAVAFERSFCFYTCRHLASCWAIMPTAFVGRGARSYGLRNCFHCCIPDQIRCSRDAVPLLRRGGRSRSPAAEDRRPLQNGRG